MATPNIFQDGSEISASVLETHQQHKDPNLNSSHLLVQACGSPPCLHGSVVECAGPGEGRFSGPHQSDCIESLGALHLNILFLKAPHKLRPKTVKQLHQFKQSPSKGKVAQKQKDDANGKGKKRSVVPSSLVVAKVGHGVRVLALVWQLSCKSKINSEFKIYF